RGLDVVGVYGALRPHAFRQAPGEVACARADIRHGRALANSDGIERGGWRLFLLTLRTHQPVGAAHTHDWRDLPPRDGMSFLPPRHELEDETDGGANTHALQLNPT